MRKLIVAMTFVVGMLAVSLVWKHPVHAQPANPTIQVFVLCLDVNGNYTNHLGDVREIEFLAPLPPISEGGIDSTNEQAFCPNSDDVAISGGYDIVPSGARGVSVTSSSVCHNCFPDFWRVSVVRTR